LIGILVMYPRWSKVRYRLRRSIGSAFPSHIPVFVHPIIAERKERKCYPP
jgi:hypothetical protein